MIHVAVDISALARNRYGGIARVCAATANELARFSDLRVTAYWTKGEKPTLPLPARIKRIGIMNRLFRPSADITHSLCHRMLPVTSRYQVYSVHDAWSLHSNPFQSDAFQRKLGDRLRREMAKADIVVTGSEWTKSELLRLDVVENNRCLVISDGVDIPQNASASEVLVRHNLHPHEYVFFVGRLEFRKNLPHIIAAVNPILTLKLVCVGEPGYGYDDSVVPALAKMPTSRVIVLSRIPEGDLHALYANALASLQPSWDEGFGLPILEAMAAGCPVITSDKGATREVGKGAAILVDPNTPEQSQSVLERLAKDSPWREQVIAAGHTRAREYTWSKYGEKLAVLYRKLYAR